MRELNRQNVFFE